MPETKLLESIFQRLPTASAIVDQQGEIVLCTLVAREMFQSFEQEARNQNISFLFDSELEWPKITSSAENGPLTLSLRGSNSKLRLTLERYGKEDQDLYLVHFELMDDKHPVLNRGPRELVFFIEHNGKVKQCSSNLHNLTGLYSKDVLGQLFWKVVHKEDSAEVEHVFKQQQKAPEHERPIRFRIKSAEGEHLWMEGECSSIFDNNGRIDFTVCSSRDITEQVKAEADQELLEKRFLEVFESVDEGIVYQDAHGAITNANKAAEQILGLTIDQMQGRTSMHPEWKATHEDGSDYPGDTHPAMMALKTGKIIKNKIMGVYQPEVQQHVWIRVNSYPLFEHRSKTPTAVYTTFSNITKEYQSVKALERSESMFRTLFDNAFQFIGLLNPDGTLIDANETGLRFMGLTKDQVIGVPLYVTPDGMLTEETQERIKTGIEQAGQGRFVRFDFELRGIEGQPITLDFSLRPVKNEEGEVIMIVPEGRDVTAKIEMAKDLSRYSSMMNSIVESVPTALFYTDKDGQVLRANKMATTMFGFATEELVGSSLSKVLLDASKVIKELKKDKGSKHNAQSVAFTVDGKRIPISVTFSNVMGAEDELAGRLFLVEDISESLEAERLRNEFTSQLSDMVTERTQELQEAKDELEKLLSIEKELNAMQSHFVMSASHQFRTPLTIIQSCAEMLEELTSQLKQEATRSPFLKYIKRIIQHVQRTISLMDDIMMLGQITSGAISPRKEKLDLVRCVRELIAQHEDTVAAERLEFTVEGENREVKLDRKLFEEPINNLLSNALKYSEKQVPVRLLFGEETVAIEVEDRGLGIAPEDQNNLFQPFFRSSEVSSYEGTGLGLAIAKEYVEAQGGIIEFESTLEQGSVFRLIYNYH